MSFAALIKKHRTLSYLLNLHEHQLQEKKLELSEVVKQIDKIQFQLQLIKEEIENLNNRFYQGGDCRALLNIRHYIAEVCQHRSKLEDSLKLHNCNEMSIKEELMKIEAKKNALEKRSGQCREQKKIILNRLSMLEQDEAELLKRTRLKI